MDPGPPLIREPANKMQLAIIALVTGDAVLAADLRRWADLEGGGGDG